MKRRDEWWTMKDGRRIKVGDMTEEHAKNALRLILRRTRKGYVTDRMEDLCDATIDDTF